MAKKIHEVAAMTGVTVRTLQYYDKIGLLHPGIRSESGYRLYEDKDILRLQEILFFRELDFPLQETKEILENPEYDRSDAMKKQYELLSMKRDRLNHLLALLGEQMKGNEVMSFKEFSQEDIKKQREQYREEVKERWGNQDAYQEYADKTKDYDDSTFAVLAGKGDEIIAEFAANKDLNPEDPKAQALAKKWQDHITDSYYTCTKEILSCLGQMYTGDSRFQKNIDKHGVGTAQFMADVIAVYTAQ